MHRTARCTLVARALTALAFLVTAAVVCSAHPPAVAQVRGRPVGEGSGPVSELSTNTGAGSKSVHRRGGNVREGNAGRLGGQPVRGSVTRDVSSGPVSAISVGPVTARHAVGTSATVTGAPAAAVSKGTDHPFGERIAAPVHDLRPLQRLLRHIQPLPRTTPLPQGSRPERYAVAPAADTTPPLSSPDRPESP
ncbi:MAG: hypothetical protein ACE5I7_11510 [Candidatus Binatia bacterium]